RVRSEAVVECCGGRRLTVVPERRHGGWGAASAAGEGRYVFQPAGRATAWVDSCNMLPGSPSSVCVMRGLLPLRLQALAEPLDGSHHRLYGGARELGGHTGGGDSETAGDGAPGVS